MATYLEDFRQGDTVRLRIKKQLRDKDSREIIEAIDLTGYIFTISFSQDFDSAPVFTRDFLAGEHYMDDAENGEIFIEIESKDTQQLEPGKYFYDVQMVTNAGDVMTVLPPKKDYKDKVRVLPDVSPE
ncbi:TPA: hypothetical protein NJ322_005012 [Vibrio parahaemolyticus]|nr:hypothetical protein [Vibrio parahaemolyticus]HCG7105656.1 hypothetical protein [Vibrio parahaemolyticus]